jgi:hypothetical protein
MTQNKKVFFFERKLTREDMETPDGADQPYSNCYNK